MSFYLFCRYFFSKRSGSLIKTISWICLGGLILSVSALILIVSVMGGLGEARKSRLLDKTAHLVIDFEETPFISQTKPYKNQQACKESHPQACLNKKKPTPKTQSLFLNREEPPIIFNSLNLKQKEGIKQALVFETQELILKSPAGFKGVLALGYSKTQWENLVKNQEIASDTTALVEESNRSQNRVKGSQLALKNTPLLKPDLTKQVFLSYQLASLTSLFKGDKLSLIPLRGLLLPPNIPPPVKIFKVGGIVWDTKEQPLSLYYPQGTMDFGDFSKINYKAEIQLHDPYQVSLYQKFFKNYKTQNWMDRHSTLFFALYLEKLMMTLFFALALMISCLGISSAMLLLISQKEEDLAILQAMGLSQKKIVSVFTKLGLLLSGSGIFIGTVIGISLTIFFKYTHFNLLPKMYLDRDIPAELAPLSYIIIVLASFILSWVFCYLPLKNISQFNLADLLKTKGF